MAGDPGYVVPEQPGVLHHPGADARLPQLVAKMARAITGSLFIYLANA